jgi:hypothetical protein
VTETKVPTLEQVAAILVGQGKALDRLGRYNREAREAAAAAGAGVESLTKQLAAVHETLAAAGVVPGADSPAAQVPDPAPGDHDANAGEPDPAEPAPAPPRPGPSWLVVASWEQAEACMGVLVPWLGQVYLRYPDATLPTCWAWHPWAVEELWWLCRAWHDAYAVPEPSSQRAGDWHDRQRPSVVRRLREDGAFRRCRLDNHTDLAVHAHPSAPGQSALPHVTTAWTSPERAAWPIAPTAAQLAEDQAAQSALTRRPKA